MGRLATWWWNLCVNFCRLHRDRDFLVLHEGDAHLVSCRGCGRTLLATSGVRIVAKVQPGCLGLFFSACERYVRERGDEAAASEVRRLSALA